jgi:hypothetical protein
LSVFPFCACSHLAFFSPVFLFSFPACFPTSPKFSDFMQHSCACS